MSILDFDEIIVDSIVMQKNDFVKINLRFLRIFKLKKYDKNYK